MKARSWRRLGGAIASAIVLIIVVKIVWFPDSWTIASALAGGECTVRLGWTQAEVARACGPPDKNGMRPKVLSDRPLSPKEWISFCSAPCEERRGHVVFYDCKGVVSDVARADPHFSGGCLR